MIHGRGWKTFFKDLNRELEEDNVGNGAAALAYYLMLSIFPAMIILLGLLPYLPVADLQGEIMRSLGELLPGDAARMFSGTVEQVVSQKQGGLLSIGVLGTLWAASSGIYAIMQQLNITYDVKEGRSFLKARATAVLLTFLFGALVVASFGLVVLGGQLQQWMSANLGVGGPLLAAFAVLRWALIVAALMFAFALMYYFAPDVEQKFRFVSPGSVLGALLMIAASLAFRLYVERFSSYSATYGSIGAVIVLMLWLNIMGYVLLLGSEVNALVEHYSPEGKNKGEKLEPSEGGRRAAA